MNGLATQSTQFVGVLVQNKKHFGEVHLAGCSDLAKGEYPTDVHATPEAAQYECEGRGGNFESGEWATDFPTIFAPCVKKAVR